MTVILKGNLVADKLYEERPQTETAPCLGIRIDTEDASESYLRAILRAAAKWGVETKVATNWKDLYDGTDCFIDLTHYEGLYSDAPPWLGDADGAKPHGFKKMCTYGKCDVDTPCTPEAIVKLLDFYDIPIAGKSVVIVGRGRKVGKPLVSLLMARDATVTICNSKTPEATLRHNLLSADIIIAASGKKDLFGASDIRCGSTVINVGGDFSEPAGDFQSFTLVPYIGGVGPVTTGVLMTHVLKAKYIEEGANA